MNVNEYSVRDLSEITKKTPAMVRRWIRSGYLKARKPPHCRDYIIRQDDFERFWYGEPQTEAAEKSSVTA